MKIQNFLFYLLTKFLESKSVFMLICLIFFNLYLKGKNKFGNQIQVELKIRYLTNLSKDKHRKGLKVLIKLN